MFTQLQVLDSLKCAKVTLNDGSVIVGSSWGLIPAENENGEDLGYDVMIFMTIDGNGSYEIDENNLISFEEVAMP